MKDDLPNDIMEELRRIARTGRDLPRDEERVRDVEKVYRLMTEYFAGSEDVEVNLLFDPVFISIATITVTGRRIDIYDREILELLGRHASYSEVVIDDRSYDKIIWFIDFAGIVKGGEEE